MSRRLAAVIALAAAAGLAGCGRDAERRLVTPAPAADARTETAGAAAATPSEPGTPGESVDGLWFPTAAVIEARVRVLADPALRGRGSASADEVVAADRMAAWFRAAGLEPGAPSGGWLQPFDISARQSSQNVIGILRGRDPRAGHIIVGAHYDHLGVGHDGAIHPGADDNASGAAALVAIAEALNRTGQRPARTIIFIAFGAEELGLFGSAYYAAHPVRPLAETALMINLDMVGRARFLSATAYSLAHALVPANAIGALTSPDGRDLALLAKAAGEREARPVVAASDFGPIESLIRPAVEYRGDHKSFADLGVPYLWLSTSMHDDYHLPSDTADKVDPATIAVVGRIVVRIIQALP